MAKRTNNELAVGSTSVGSWLDLAKLEAATTALTKERVHESTMQTLRDLNTMGCVVVPGARGEKRPAGNWKGTTTSASPDLFNTGQIGILTGPSGLCVIDVDTKDNGVVVWNAIVALLGIEALIRDRVPHERTTSGGFHFYFANPPSGELKTRAKLKICQESAPSLDAGIDVRSTGGFIRCSPCAHVGKQEDMVSPYITWVRSPDPTTAFPSLPEALAGLLRGQTVICQGAHGYSIADAPVTEVKRPRPAVSPPRQPRALNNNEEDPEVRRLVMELLAQTRAETRDDWLRVIMALSYEDKRDHKEERYLQLCKDFSKRTGKDNLATDEEIAKQYVHGFHSSAPNKVTMGTLRLWAQEDSPVVLPPAPNSFDESTYYWSDFCGEVSARTWETLDALERFCQTKLPRVLALISRAPPMYITKHSKDERYLPFAILPDVYSCEVAWCTPKRSRDGSPGITQMKFKQFFEKYHRKLVRGFKSIAVDPENTRDKSEVFNIWPGLRAQRLEQFDPAKVAAFQEVLRLWANGDDKAYHYLLAWMRFLVTKPGTKANTALVITGREGAGKSVLCEFLQGFVLGPLVTATFEGVEDMVEKHNCRKAGKRLWVLEECRSTREDFLHAMDSLKRLITNPRVTENPKGLPICEVDNIGMAIILSNHADCINVTATDRRYSFFQVSEARCGANHQDWWRGIRGALLTQDTGNHVYTWLLSLGDDLPNPTVPFENETRTRAQHYSKPAHHLFMEERLQAIPKGTAWWIGKLDLFQEYKEWCGDSGHRCTLTATHFHSKVQSELNLQPRRVRNCHGYCAGGTSAYATLQQQPKWRQTTSPEFGTTHEEESPI